jgi:hypothetical protein
MAPRILSLPEDLIHRRLNRRNLRLETVAVVVLGLLGSIGYAYAAIRINDGIANPPPYMNFNLIGMVVTPAVVFVGMWFWYSVFSHFVSKYAGGRRPINRMFRTAAWSLLPVAAWYLIRSLVIVVLFLGVDVPAAPEGTSAEEQMTTVLELALEDPIFVAVQLLGLVFVARSWHLLGVAISEAREVDLSTARRIAIIPAATVAVYVISVALDYQTVL